MVWRAASCASIFCEEAVYGLPELHRAELAGRNVCQRHWLYGDRRHPGIGSALPGRTRE